MNTPSTKDQINITSSGPESYDGSKIYTGRIHEAFFIPRTITIDFREWEALQKELALKQQYIDLLGEEISELASVASVRGWKSTRYEQGEKIREELERLKS